MDQEELCQGQSPRQLHKSHRTQEMKVDSRTLNSHADVLVKHTHAHTQCTHTLESTHTPAEELSIWREGGEASCQLSPCVHCIKPELFLVLLSQSFY